MNGVAGLAFGPVDGVADLAVIVRFSPAGTIDARNGSVYAADRVAPYTAEPYGRAPCRGAVIISLAQGRMTWEGPLP